MVIDASEKKKRKFDVSELLVSTKCGESDTTSGLASNPTIGVTADTLVPEGATLLFEEASELTGAGLGGAKISAPELKEVNLRA